MELLGDALIVKTAKRSRFYDTEQVVARWRPDGSYRPILDEAPVFHPKEEEFIAPVKYIDSIRATAEPYGICRIVPPSFWKREAPSSPKREKTVGRL